MPEVNADNILDTLGAFAQKPTPDLFKGIVGFLWGPDSPMPYEWNPWNELALQRCCEHQYVALNGAASTGKSDFGAIWALVNWLADPEHTLVLVTSTTIKDSKKRMWGRIIRYFDAAKANVDMPGEALESIIRTVIPGVVTTDNSSIALLAGEKKKEREAVGKMIGMKNERVYFIADELPELSDALTEAFVGNLSKNPRTHMLGIGNFSSIYDAFGRLCTPKNGYSSITPDDTEWETELGWCIRYDGLKSPNFDEDKDRWKFLYNRKNLADDRKRMGENTISWWRMVRAFPCPASATNTIYSESDFVAGRAHDTVVFDSPPIKIAALDPAYTHNGDRCPAIIFQFGKNKGLPTLAVDKLVLLREDVTMLGTTRDFQIAVQFMQLCLDNQVSPENAGIDATGAGKPFLSIVHEKWSMAVMGIEFGGAASSRPVFAHDPRPAHELYVNRVSELWFVGREFMRAGQLRSIPNDIARQMKSRQYTIAKGATVRTQVEPKPDLKKRIGFSPDEADCFVGQTLVATPSGSCAIESLQVGDFVLTPFGKSQIVIKHEREVTELCRVTFSDGTVLEGKGKHRIFTKQGWTRLDRLSLTNEIESVKDRPLWQLLNLLFTRVINTGFKTLVDIIRDHGRGGLRRRDFFIESCGLSTTALFLKTCASITRMGIGAITGSKTWRRCLNQITAKCTGPASEAIRLSMQKLWQGLLMRVSPLPHGIALPREDRGIRDTAKKFGRTENAAQRLNANARIAGRASSPGQQELNIVLPVALVGLMSTSNTPLREFASFAVKSLWRVATRRRKLVPIRVEHISLAESKKVYNLTLLEENAYYANGILADNCWAIGLEICRQRFGFSAENGVTSFASLRKKFMDKALEVDKVNQNFYGVSTGS